MADVGKPNVLISTKIARDYPNSDGTPKKVGDTLLIGGKPFQMIGIYETGSFLIDTTVVMEITHRPRAAQARQGLRLGLLRRAQAARRSRRAGRSDHRPVADVQVRSMSQFNIQVGNIMGKLDLFLLLTVGLALLVGGVGIANTMLMSAMERIVEFGVMRANGWTRRNILGLVTAESALAGLAFGAGGQRPGLRRDRRSSITCSAGFELRLELTPELVAASNRHGDRDRDGGRPVPRLARFPHDPDGRNPQRGLMRPALARSHRPESETCMIRVSDVREVVPERRGGSPGAARRFVRGAAGEPARSSSARPARARARCSTCWCARQPDLGNDRDRRRDHDRHERGRARRLPPPEDRLRLPAVQPDP